MFFILKRTNSENSNHFSRSIDKRSKTIAPNDCKRTTNPKRILTVSTFFTSENHSKLRERNIPSFFPRRHPDSTVFVKTEINKRDERKKERDESAGVEIGSRTLTV
ncbi:hypothetical protein AVEN_148675-1 [Araneus ventricosus]|uniref:Uncharacterized protein n=1 Tax=Araneus ventricosus TaxID=182803 RepID=A0A4Y2G7X5_ARAVE|nr:hypothetical protein AVEN_148675-1 [Araneus ventricosus]